MKTKYTVLLALLILSLSTSFARADGAQDVPASSPPAGGQVNPPSGEGSTLPQSPNAGPLPQAGAAPIPGGPIPNQRELSEQDYAWLGRVVWARMQLVADPQKLDLNETDISALVDEMRRNRNEVNLTLDGLYALMRSPALCPVQKVDQPRGGPGVDIDRAGRFLQRLFR